MGVEVVVMLVLVELIALIEWVVRVESVVLVESVERAERVAGCLQSPLASPAFPRVTFDPQPSSAQPACAAALEPASRSAPPSLEPTQPSLELTQPSLEPTQPSLALVGPQHLQLSSARSVLWFGAHLSRFVEDAVATEASWTWTRTS